MNRLARLALAALLAMGCQTAPPTAPSAAPSQTAADRGSALPVWTEELERVELEHLQALPDIDAAVALELYARATSAAGFGRRARARRPLSPAVIERARAAAGSEQAFALAYPVVPARRRVLEVLVRDSDPKIRIRAWMALVLNGAKEVLPDARADAGSAFFDARQAWDGIRAFYVPGGSEAFWRFTRSDAHPFFRAQAALALAEAGDLRSVPLLADILRRDPCRAYFGLGDTEEWSKLTEDDKQAAAAARAASNALTDLALARPDQIPTIREQSEDALADWVKRSPNAYPGAPAAAAAMKSPKLLATLRALAFPTAPLPAADLEWQAPPSYHDARLAMRALVWIRDDASYAALLDQLARRPPDFAVSQQVQGKPGWTLSDTLTILAAGAAEALGAWGDLRAYEPLRAHARDRLNAEASRVIACRALVQLTPESDLPKLLESALPRANQAEDEKQFAYCLLQGFERRPVKSQRLWSLLDGRDPSSLSVSGGRVLGWLGISAEEKGLLLQRLQERTSSDAFIRTLLTGVALLGADADTAVQAVRATPGALDADPLLADFWASSFDSIGEEEIASGRLFRAVKNAVAVSRELMKSGKRPWPTELLSGSLSPVRLGRDARELPHQVRRERLLKLAASPSAEQAEGAIWTLALVEPHWLLEILRSSAGALSETVRDAMRFAEEHSDLLAQAQKP